MAQSFHNNVFRCAVLRITIHCRVSPSLGSNFFDYKWLIFGFIIASIVGYNILIFRCENYEATIEKMNDEIEILKDEVKLLKKKDKE